MSKHTPGPWEVGACLSNSTHRFYVDVAHTSKMPEHGMIADNLLEANARLIAAAPDLLEAAKNLRALLSQRNKALPEDIKYWMSVSADAIAKAEGRP